MLHRDEPGDHDGAVDVGIGPVGGVGPVGVGRVAGVGEVGDIAVGNGCNPTSVVGVRVGMRDAVAAEAAAVLEDVASADVAPEDAASEDAGPGGGDPLVRALVDDLDSGFVELFETYQGLVFSVALRVSGRFADAEDVTAEAFLRAYRALSRYEPGRIGTLRVRPWLLTIVMNLGRNRWRTTSRKPPPEALDARGEGPGGTTGLDRLSAGLVDRLDSGDAVEDAALRRETSGELAELLGRLTHDQRAAVVLRHVVDLPVAEIAKVLGQPQGTVKSHISRGLRRLRALTLSQEVPDVRPR